MSNTNMCLDMSMQVEEDEAWKRRQKGNKEPRCQRSSSSAHVIAQLAKYICFNKYILLEITVYHDNTQVCERE